jgi:hypothetical protein
VYWCRQVEALRLLYNEELARASKLAVELSKATAAADKVRHSGSTAQQVHSPSWLLSSSPVVAFWVPAVNPIAVAVAGLPLGLL